jgi:hypothetical protein
MVRPSRSWVGDRPASRVATLCGRVDLPVLGSDDLTDAMLADVARAALYRRSKTRSVFTPANIHVDVERQLHGVRFARSERTKVADRAVGLALGTAVKLTPPELLQVPARFRAPDGVSQFAPAASWQYSTQDLLDAEARLLQAGRNASRPTVSYGTTAAVATAPCVVEPTPWAPTRPSRWNRSRPPAATWISWLGRPAQTKPPPWPDSARPGRPSTGRAALRAWPPRRQPPSTLAEELRVSCENSAIWLTELDRQEARRAEISRL